jgi:hypothetical protein
MKASIKSKGRNSFTRQAGTSAIGSNIAKCYACPDLLVTQLLMATGTILFFLSRTEANIGNSQYLVK